MQSTSFNQTTKTKACFSKREKSMHLSNGNGENRMSPVVFPYPTQDLHGVEFGFFSFPPVVFPYPKENLFGVQFGFFEEKAIQVEEWKKERKPTRERCIDRLQKIQLGEQINFARRNFIPYKSLIGGGALNDSVSEIEETTSDKKKVKENVHILGLKKYRKGYINYGSIGLALRQFCTIANIHNMKQDGPFGLAANTLKWQNTYSNRYYLQKIWNGNRGNVRFIHKLKMSNPSKYSQNIEKANDKVSTLNSKVKSHEEDKTIQNDNKNCLKPKRKLSLGKKKTKIPTEHVENKLNQVSHQHISEHEEFDKVFIDNENNASKRIRKRRVPFSPSMFQNQKRTNYCVCNVSFESIDDGRMIECEECECWYHCSCLNLPRLPNSVKDKEIKFKCGRNGCNNNKSVYSVQGKIIDTLFNDQHNLNNNDVNFTNKSLDLIKVIDDETVLIKDQISLFSGSSNDKKYKYISELLTTKLLNLDEIPTYGFSNVKSTRKTTIDKVLSMIKSLDLKVESDKNLTETPTFKVYDIDPLTNSINEENIAEQVNLQLSNEDLPMELSSTINSKENEMDIDANDDLEPSVEDSFISCPLDRDTIGDILHVKIPDYFTASISSTATFSLSSDQVDHLNKIKNGRMYMKGQWQHVFTEGMSLSNKFCVFMFDRHQISSSGSRTKKHSVPYFKASAHCKFEDCTVKATVKMWTLSKVTIEYTGNIKHNVTHEHARPIRGTEREILKDRFQYGAKPLKQYLDISHKKDTEQLIAGNCNGLGKDSHVFRQISSESRKIGRRDENILKSLLVSASENSDGFGFIHKICAKPSYLLYWSEEGLRLYHQLAPKDALFWDATGSVVKKNETGKSYLYYELAIRHPVKGKMGLPVSAMITEDQSLPPIQDWITSFRHAEKKLFGHGNVCQPKLIISDEAWVFILASLKEFNNENLQEFLDRSWKISVGKSNPSDTTKTIVHLCTSHFMHKVKKFCSKHYKRNLNVGLYMISLLLNSQSLLEAEEILHDVIMALNQPLMTKTNKPYIDRLMAKINAFDTSLADVIYTDDSAGDVEENAYEMHKPGFYSEDDFLTLAPYSPFKRWAKNLVDKCIDKDPMNRPGNKNPYYSDKFLDQLINRYIPIFPLWGSLLLKDIQRECVNTSKYNVGGKCRTQSTVENRFRILKYIALDGRKNSRLDDFSEILKQHTIDVQRSAAKDSLKSSGKVKRTRSTKTIKESWNKSQLPSENLINKLGSFQKPPSRVIKTSRESVTSPKVIGKNMLQQTCPMQNLGATCWFNSVIQAIGASCMSQDLIDFMDSQPIVIEDPHHIVKVSIINIFRFIHNNSTSVPSQFIRDALYDISCVNDDLGVSLQQQHDANEFYQKVLSPMAEDLQEKLEIDQVFTCLDCEKVTTVKECHVQSLTVVIPNKPGVQLTSSELIKEYFDHDIREKCESCGGLRDVKPTVTKMPTTLILTIKRFSFDAAKGTSSKIDTPVSPDTVLDLGIYSNVLTNTSYKLKSIVCHHGPSYNTGHYTTFIPLGEHGFKKISDSSVTMGSKVELLSTCYVLVYDRSKLALPEYTDSIIKCLSNSRGIKTEIGELGSRKMSTNTKMILSDVGKGKLAEDTKIVLSSLIAKATQYEVCKTAHEFTEFLMHSLFWQNSSENESNIGAECFKIVYAQVNECVICNKCTILSPLLKGIMFPTGFSSNDISKCFLMPKIQCTECSSINSVQPTLYLSWLPYTLIISVAITEHTKFSHDIFGFDLAGKIDTSHSLISQEYVLSSMIIDQDGKHQVCFPEDGQQFLIQNSDTQFSIITVSDLSKYDRLLLFYDMKNKSSCFPQMSKVHKLDNLQPLLVPQQLFRKSDIDKFVDRTQGKMPITCTHVKELSRDTYWLKSDDIDCYMHLLASSTPENVHMVNSGWFSHRIIGEGCATEIKSIIFKLESKSVNWMTMSKIFIPVNIRNFHWILITIDVSKKIIYYCDSFGKQTDIIMYQIIRYLSYECLVRTGKKLEIRKWKTCNYCLMNNFPRQKDGSSCGIYICAMAKCILFGRNLPEIGKLSLYIRSQIARELMTGTVEY